MSNRTGFLIQVTQTILLLAQVSNAEADMVAIPGRCVYQSDVTIATVPLTLKNLPGVRVVVSDRFASGQDPSLAKGLRSDIERVLARAGIRVLSKAECERTPGHPTLHFETQGTGVSLEMKETACLIRRPEVCTPVVNYRVATSYSVGGPVAQPRVVSPMQDADSISAANENYREDCATQEIQMLHDLARELATDFVGAFKYQNRSRRLK